MHLEPTIKKESKFRIDERRMKREAYNYSRTSLFDIVEEFAISETTLLEMIDKYLTAAQIEEIREDIRIDLDLDGIDSIEPTLKSEGIFGKNKTKTPLKPQEIGNALGIRGLDSAKTEYTQADEVPTLFKRCMKPLFEMFANVTLTIVCGNDSARVTVNAGELNEPFSNVGTEKFSSLQKRSSDALNNIAEAIQYKIPKAKATVNADMNKFRQSNPYMNAQIVVDLSKARIERLNEAKKVTWPNGNEVTDDDPDIEKALNYQFGLDRNPDMNSYTADEKQRAVNAWVEYMDGPNPYNAKKPATEDEERIVTEEIDLSPDNLLDKVNDSDLKNLVKSAGVDLKGNESKDEIVGMAKVLASQNESFKKRVGRVAKLEASKFKRKKGIGLDKKVESKFLR